MKAKAVTADVDEYIAPDSPIYYWHGWWRFMWHWHEKNVGLLLPSLKMSLAHRKYCDSKSWDKFGLSISLWRLSVCFSCNTIEESRAYHRRLFKDDIWPTIIVEDPLDADEVG